MYLLILETKHLATVRGAAQIHHDLGEVFSFSYHLVEDFF